MSRPWQTPGILSAQLRQLLPSVKHFKTISGLVCSPPVPDLSFQYNPWSEPHLRLIAWCLTSPLSLFCSQFPVSLYIPYLVVFSPDLVYFPRTWFIFPGPGLILSPALPCSAVRLFTCHRKYSTLVRCTISTWYSEPRSLQSEINFVTIPDPLCLFPSVWSEPTQGINAPLLVIESNRPLNPDRTYIHSSLCPYLWSLLFSPHLSRLNRTSYRSRPRPNRSPLTDRWCWAIMYITIGVIGIPSKTTINYITRYYCMTFINLEGLLSSCYLNFTLINMAIWDTVAEVAALIKTTLNYITRYYGVEYDSIKAWLHRLQIS